MSNDRFVSPCPPPEGAVRELLTILIEEAAEVQQRATKALRFGVEEVQPGQDLSNAIRLGREVGDFQEVLNRLIDAGTIPLASIEDGRANKRRQLDKFMQSAPASPTTQPADVSDPLARIDYPDGEWMPRMWDLALASSDHGEVGSALTLKAVAASHGYRASFVQQEVPDELADAGPREILSTVAAPADAPVEDSLVGRTMDEDGIINWYVRPVDGVARSVTPAPMAELPLGFFSVPNGLHPDTAHLVSAFASALAAKLRLSEVKYGWTANWMRPDWREELTAELLRHVHKGDPVDAAAYCAFAWHHGWSVAPSPQPQPDAALVEAESEVINAVVALDEIGSFHDRTFGSPVFNAARGRMREALGALRTARQDGQTEGEG